MGNTWKIQESMNLSGHTDWTTKTLTVPRGDTPVEMAVRAHEVFHAIYSPPHKPKENTEAWEWLEEARIDDLVDSLGKPYEQGIRAFRQMNINEWLRYGQKSSRRACFKVAVLGRGYKMNEYLDRIEDRILFSKMYSTIVAGASDDEMADMARRIDENIPPDNIAPAIGRAERSYTGFESANPREERLPF